MSSHSTGGFSSETSFKIFTVVFPIINDGVRKYNCFSYNWMKYLKTLLCLNDRAQLFPINFIVVGISEYFMSFSNSESALNTVSC